MKKGSSGNRRKAPPRRETPPPRRYPMRDNVYSFEQERQRKQRQAYGQKPKSQPAPASAKKQKKQRKKRRRAYMVMPLLIFAMIAVYLCGQIFMLASRKPEINVETVEYGSITAPQLHTGLIVREEYVGTSTRSGQPFYQYSQGDYVMKGATVCTVKDTDSTDAIEDKLDAIDLDILKSQKARTDLSVFSEDIARLEDNITRTVDTYAGRSMKSNVSYMYTMKSQVTSFMDQRNEIWLTENVDSLSQLTQERNSYQQQLAKSMSSIQTQESGILCLSYDGLEATLTPPDTLDSITEAQMGGAKTEYISKAKTAAEGDPLFKIVSSNKWYIVAFLPAQDVLGWEKGDTRTLDIATEEETMRVSATVETLEPGEEKTKVVFSSYEYMESFMERRTLSFSLKNNAVEGLKIPNDAIVEKSLLRIPVEYIEEGGMSKGVTLANGEKGRFLEVPLIASDEEYAYVEQSGGVLKTGDVILKGEGEDAERYTVSDLALQTGVYVANSSMARFVVVEILEQNQEYAIVKAGQNSGLQPYDTIVSDAKNVTEGQSIY